MIPSISSAIPGRHYDYIIDTTTDDVPTPPAGTEFGGRILLDKKDVRTYIWDPSIKSSIDLWISIDSDVYAVSGQTSAPGTTNQQAVHHNVTTSPRDRGRAYERKKIITESCFTTEVAPVGGNPWLYQIYVESVLAISVPLSGATQEEYQQYHAVEVAANSHIQHFINANGMPIPQTWTTRWFAQCWLHQQLNPT